jgi:hypothetical protein
LLKKKISNPLRYFKFPCCKTKDSGINIDVRLGVEHFASQSSELFTRLSFIHAFHHKVDGIGPLLSSLPLRLHHHHQARKIVPWFYSWTEYYTLKSSNNSIKEIVPALLAFETHLCTWMALLSTDFPRPHSVSKHTPISESASHCHNGGR